MNAKYRPEIDGLRAVAVLPVILFHAGSPLFSGGYVGVDVFFVISGFLITSIILDDLENNRFSIVDFYERRARRILPALIVIIAACIPFGWLWMGSEDFAGLAKSAAATALFSSNILFWSESGYFDASAELKPLLHTWSLAVEEQFYIFFPLLLLALVRFRKKVSATPLVLMLLTSLALCEWAAYALPKANYFLLPTRGWELLIGSVAAVYTRGRARAAEGKIAEILSAAGLALLLSSIFLYNSSTPFPSLYALLPTIGTSLIILFAQQGTLTNKLLASRPLVQIGLISYSAYLWHQPLLAFARHRAIGEVSPVVLSVIVVAIFPLSYITWRFIENPFRNRAAFSRNFIFSASIASLLLVTALSSIAILNNGFPGREFSGITLGALDSHLRANHGLSKSCDIDFTVSNACVAGKNPSVVLWGDSYAMHLAPALESSATQKSFRQHTVNACSPIIGIAALGYDAAGRWAEKCIEQNKKVLDWIIAQPSIELVIMASPFSPLSKGKIFYDGKVRDYSYTQVLERTKNTIQLLKDAGKKVVLVAPPPKTGEDLGRCYSKAIRFDSNPKVCDFQVKDLNEPYKWAESFLKDIERVAPVLWLSDLLCNNGVCMTSLGGAPLYRDTGHLSVSGAKVLGEQFNLMGRLSELGNTEVSALDSRKK